MRKNSALSYQRGLKLKMVTFCDLPFPNKYSAFMLNRYLLQFYATSERACSHFFGKSVQQVPFPEEFHSLGENYLAGCDQMSKELSNELIEWSHILYNQVCASTMIEPPRIFQLLPTTVELQLKRNLTRSMKNFTRSPPPRPKKQGSTWNSQPDSFFIGFAEVPIMVGWKLITLIIMVAQFNRTN